MKKVQTDGATTEGKARNRSACEARRLHEALTLQQKREEEDGRVGGWRDGGQNN